MDYPTRTRWGYAATRILDTPFWAIYNLLHVILYKDLQLSALHITIMIALKPLLSLASLYWSSLVNQRRDRLLPNIIWARILGYLPFFFFPFVDNPWFFIFSFGLYMMLAVGIVPAWMEILKLNLPQPSRGKIFSYAQAFGYIGGGLLPFLFGWLLDGHSQSWRWIFPAAAAIALSSLVFQCRIRIPKGEAPLTTRESSSFWKKWAKPWQSAWNALSENPEFRFFQWSSMIMGSGLMIIQPAILFFFVDSLQLSYLEIAFALAFCKGMGFALASPLWPRLMQRMNLYKLSSMVAILAALFPIFLYAAQAKLIWLYIAYLCYGIMQSGNELIWNLSGTHFAKDRDSSVFTSVNLLSTGIRGCCLPALGSSLVLLLGAASVLGMGALLCFTSAITFSHYVGRTLKSRMSS